MKKLIGLLLVGMLLLGIVALSAEAITVKPMRTVRIRTYVQTGNLAVARSCEVKIVTQGYIRICSTNAQGYLTVTLPEGKYYISANAMNYPNPAKAIVSVTVKARNPLIKLVCKKPTF